MNYKNPLWTFKQYGKEVSSNEGNLFKIDVSNYNLWDIRQYSAETNLTMEMIHYASSRCINSRHSTILSNIGG